MSSSSSVSDPVAAALSAFPPVRGHLDAATSGVPPLAAVEAVQRAVADWAAGRIDGPGFDEPVERSRAAFARLLGVRPADVATGTTVSGFAGVIAGSLEPGQEVLVAEGDFASVLFPFLVQERRGVRVRVVALEQLVEAIDARTALVAVSAVQSSDGRRIDLDALAAAADAGGADVLLDVTQAAGWAPIDGNRFAYVVAGAYKWLLSPRGTAFLAVRPDRLDAVRPAGAGWYAVDGPWENVYGTPLRLAAGAKRLDLSPPWICWAGTAPALELIERIGVEAIGRHDLALAARLRQGLGMPPADSAIVTVDVPRAEQRLGRAGVRGAVREPGRVRLSCHLPATVADIDLALNALTG